MKPQVIFEDGEILVLDKPAGMIVNKADTTKNEVTLQEWVEEYLKGSEVSNVPKVSKGNSPFDTFDTFSALDTFIRRAGIAHRLDKETSGIILVAKTLDAFDNLQKQFKERVVKKIYTALVHGKVVPEEGEINVPVGRLPWDRMRFGVVAGGKEATTKYKVISNFKFPRLPKPGTGGQVISNEDLSLLELYPKTGRTHQIRVHLKYLGYPIFSDPLYGGRKQMKKDRKILPRIFLHASKISLLHPKTGETISFEAMLSEALQTFLQSLSKN